MRTRMVCPGHGPEWTSAERMPTRHLALSRILIDLDQGLTPTGWLALVLSPQVENHHLAASACLRMST